MGQALETVNLSIRKGRLSPIERQYATKAALDHELRIVTTEEMGRGAVERIFESDTLHDKLKNTTLTPGQRSAIELMLVDKNQIVGIQGVAGTGNSYTLQKTQNLLAEQGYKLQDLRFHDFRHTWASWHMQAGTPLFVLKELGDGTP